MFKAWRSLQLTKSKSWHFVLGYNWSSLNVKVLNKLEVFALSFICNTCLTCHKSFWHLSFFCVNCLRNQLQILKSNFESSNPAWNPAKSSFELRIFYVISIDLDCVVNHFARKHPKIAISINNKLCTQLPQDNCCTHWSIIIDSIDWIKVLWILGSCQLDKRGKYAGNVIWIINASA